MRYLGLVHHPIKNKFGEVVTTSVTNLDIHDIARSVRTFGFKKYFIITPLHIQHAMVQKILTHWEKSENMLYNPDRSSALGTIKLVNSIEQAQCEIEELEGFRSFNVVTGAHFDACDGGINDLNQRLMLDNRPLFLLFGTGHGLHASVIESADFRLASINGSADDGYNHLSVRSAVAIYLHGLQEASAPRK